MNNEINKQVEKEFEQMRRDIDRFDAYINSNNLDRQDLRNLLGNLRVDFNKFEATLTERLKGFVSVERFSLTEKLVFGAVTLVLVSVVGGLMALVIKSGS